MCALKKSGVHAQLWLCKQGNNTNGLDRSKQHHSSQLQDRSKESRKTGVSLLTWQCVSMNYRDEAPESALMGGVPFLAVVFSAIQNPFKNLVYNHRFIADLKLAPLGVTESVFL